MMPNNLILYDRVLSADTVNFQKLLGIVIFIANIYFTEYWKNVLNKSNTQCYIQRKTIIISTIIIFQK